MKYVGATNSYIRIPYLLEGAFTGILGAFIAWALLLLAYGRIYDWAMQDTARSSAWALLESGSLAGGLLAVLLLTGISVGALGSAISVRKYVNV